MPTPEQVEQLFAIHNSPERRRELLLRSYGFDDTRSWVDANGYRLSDRLWRARRAVRDQIDQVLRRAIASGQDGIEVANILEQFLDPSFSPIRNELARLVRGQRKSIVTSSPGRGGMGSFPARRIARTEITRAHGQATIMVAERTPFATGVRWHTSGSHPRADECDFKAAGSPYPPNRVPGYPSHPQCLCYLTVETFNDTDAVVDRLRIQLSIEDS
jgi:hypothetical protein